MPKTLNELECEAIEKALAKHGKDLTKAALALGVGRATLYRKMKQYGLDGSAPQKPKLTAKDGYFMAKREIGEAIMRRVEKLEKMRDDLKNSHPVTGNHKEYDACIRSLEEVRSFVRNVMLWDTSND